MYLKAVDESVLFAFFNFALSKGSPLASYVKIRLLEFISLSTSLLKKRKILSNNLKVNNFTLIKLSVR